MLSITILTKNSQKYLDKVLKSASFADEIIVLDSGSSDDTKKICENFKNLHFFENEWLGFGKMKQKAVDLAKNEWIFVLDSDEIITDELKNEILTILKNPEFKAYKVARLNYFFGKAIKNMGLYPDYSLRFFNKNFAKFDDRMVHEKVITNEKIGFLKEHFLHYAYENLEQFRQKQKFYASLHTKKSFFKAYTSPIWKFFKLYFLQGGIINGKIGFDIAKIYALYTFWKYK